MEQRSPMPFAWDACYVRVTGGPWTEPLAGTTGLNVGRRIRRAYLMAEKSAGSMKTESTFSTIFPFASEAAATFFHSGSLRNAAQFVFAASRLGWART